MSKNTTLEEIIKYSKNVHFRFDNCNDYELIIMVSSYLDEILQVMLKSYLRQDYCEKLFEYPGALSDFCSKIDVAYALGLINKITKESLHCIRKIRNEFSHNFIKMSFGNNKIISYVNELKCLNKKLLLFFGWTLNDRENFRLLSIIFIDQLLLNALKMEKEKKINVR